MTFIKVKRTSPDAKLPFYATDQAIGCDLYAIEAKTLNPGERALIKTGLVFEPARYVDVQVRSRSGLALKNGVCVLNAPGTIDPDYRGDVGVLLINLGDQAFKVLPGDRIAQVVTNPPGMPFVEVDATSETERGIGGFGSTGR